jgi:hypothetical protein
MPTIAAAPERHRTVNIPQQGSMRPRAPVGMRGAAADPRNRIIGTWKMVSWTVEDLATGDKHDAFGPDPAGYITYSSDGRVMVLVLQRDRKRPAELVPTNDEKISLYDSMFAYAGTFSIDGEKVVHHIDMSWNQAWTGTHQVRFYTLRDGMLTYVGAPARNPMNGRDCVHTVIFRRSE